MDEMGTLRNQAAGAIGGGLAGLVTTGTLRGMVVGAVSGAAFAGIGNAFAQGGRLAGARNAGSTRVKASGHGQSTAQIRTNHCSHVPLANLLS